MLGVSRFRWIPAEGDVVLTPPPTSLSHFSQFSQSQSLFEKCAAVSRRGESTSMSNHPFIHISSIQGSLNFRWCPLNSLYLSGMPWSAMEAPQ
ncbi:hypothetical protein Q5P01_018415 [Channa striata]|uniref:Uncharacterized protein n=1 Tax=Channa striata TaxID=64152 RepID=A0AA88SFW9_CHASR|nr:hypothetical protein Q5P01_018415 [Channa striata]